jgi:NAD(P)-dependent dehydrogenase (short-subunit alcohol dehydrogenase family)
LCIQNLKSEALKTIFRNPGNYSTELIDSLAAKYLDDVKAGRWEEEGWVVGTGQMYSESKIFMNAYAVALAKSLSTSQSEDHKIFVMSFCPGFVDTEMLARALPPNLDPRTLPAGLPLKSAREGGDAGVWLALLPKEELASKNGKFFGEREEYPFGWIGNSFDVASTSKPVWSGSAQ